MTPEEFNDALTALAWKGSDFARKAGTVDNTVWRWRKGHTPIPQWVGEYLGAVLAIQRLHAQFVAVPRSPGAPDAAGIELQAPPPEDAGDPPEPAAVGGESVRTEPPGAG